MSCNKMQLNQPFYIHVFLKDGLKPRSNYTGVYQVR
jgi:hypothetical protein